MLCIDRLSDSELIERITTAQTELFRRVSLRGKEGTCVRCHSRMVKRDGKHGPFMACSGYPDCKFTVKIEGEDVKE